MKRKLKLDGKGVDAVRAHNALNIKGLRYKLESMRDNEIKKTFTEAVVKIVECDLKTTVLRHEYGAAAKCFGVVRNGQCMNPKCKEFVPGVMTYSFEAVVTDITPNIMGKREYLNVKCGLSAGAALFKMSDCSVTRQ